MARSVEGETLWRQQTTARRYALEPLRTALTREGRTQIWLARQLSERVGIHVGKPSLHAYLTGHVRIPRNVLSAACWIAGAREADVLGRIADEAVLLQQPRKNSERRKAASVA